MFSQSPTFAYLTSAALELRSRRRVRGGMAKESLDLSEEEKMKWAKKTFGRTERQHLQRACRSCHALTRVVEVEMKVEVGASEDGDLIVDAGSGF